MSKFSTNSDTSSIGEPMNVRESPQPSVSGLAGSSLSAMSGYTNVGSRSRQLQFDEITEESNSTSDMGHHYHVGASVPKSATSLSLASTSSSLKYANRRYSYKQSQVNQYSTTGIGGTGSGSSSCGAGQEQRSSPEEEDEIIQLPDIEYPTTEPIVIRGDGNITLFGLSNMFSGDFPSTLIGRISKEEFQITIERINRLLRDHHSTNVKLLLLGCLCCCCSFGCSLLWPTLALSKRTRVSLEKLLAEENHKLYNQLGYNWRLDKEICHNNTAFMEYVILIEHLPKMHLYRPD